MNTVSIVIDYKSIFFARRESIRKTLESKELRLRFPRSVGAPQSAHSCTSKGQANAIFSNAPQSIVMFNLIQ